MTGLGISYADLERVAERITESVRYEVGLARAEAQRDTAGVYKRIDELRERQDAQNGRVNRQELAIGALGTRLDGQGESLASCLKRVHDTTLAVAQLDARTAWARTSESRQDSAPQPSVDRKRATVWSLLAALAAGLTWLVSWLLEQRS